MKYGLFCLKVIAEALFSPAPTTPVRQQPLPLNTEQKEEPMQTQQNELQFELNQFPPEGRFQLNQFYIVLSNVRLEGKWRVTDAVALATFRELSAKTELIENMVANFTTVLTIGHSVREGHEAVEWSLSVVPETTTRNGYRAPKPSKHQWNDLEHPANGFARAPQHEYSNLPYSGLTNEALVELLGHYSLTQTLRFRPETNASQMPAGLLLLDLVCERLMTQAPPAQVGYPSNVYYPPHHMRTPINPMQSYGQFAPPVGHWNFSQPQSPMTVSDFKSTPNLMEMMVHVNRTVNAMCGPGSLESARISQEIHSAFKALGDGNWPTDQKLYLLVGGLSYANTAVQAMIAPDWYSGWVIVDEPTVFEPTFCLYVGPKIKRERFDLTIPAINFKFAVGDTLLDTMANIAEQMNAQKALPLNATVDLLAQIQRVLETKPIDSKEHVVLNFSMGPRPTFSEGLRRAMQDTCVGCWIIYTDKTISDDTNDLPERFWCLELKQDLGGGLW